MLLAPTTSSDNKGKTVASSPSVSESGYHAEIGQTDDADTANNVDLKL
jgi:E3 ubiquitin-protein ligase synoviolin